MTRAKHEENFRGSGPIAWMVHNHVTANLLMLVFIIGGLFMTTQIKQEYFPEFELDFVNISVAYPGASPEEVERGIVMAIEEVVRGVEGVAEVTSTASENVGRVSAELLQGANRQKVFQEIEQEVNRIRTFPEEAEEPRVNLASRRFGVIELILYGDVTEWGLRNLAEDLRDRLLTHPEITLVDISNTRDLEIIVEISQANLRSYGLTMRDVASRLRNTAVELPAGTLETGDGDILLRFNERRDWAEEFQQIPIVAAANGATVRLGDIATVRDGFEDSDRITTFNGMPAIGLDVFRIGRQTPISVADAFYEVMEQAQMDLPPGVDWVVVDDDAETYRERLQLLLKNAFIGLTLVMFLLSLFLEFKLAFWVVMGIPVSFLGTILFLPFLHVSINMISMFAFIIALGIVVDDAIVAGENIYEYRQRGMTYIEAAIKGAQSISTPIAFSILTNIIAFYPLATVPGVMGKIWSVIPAVVSTAFLISWVEALFILPAHLAYARKFSNNKFLGQVSQMQQGFSRGVTSFIENVYGPVLRIALRHRYITVSIGVLILAWVFGYAMSGRLGFNDFPQVESDQADAMAILPVGVSRDEAVRVRDRLVRSAQITVDENGGQLLSFGVLGVIDENRVSVTTFLQPPQVRPMSTSEFTNLWRDHTGFIPNARTRFLFDRRGPGGGGAGVTVELSHRDIETLERASAALAAEFGTFPQARDIDEGFDEGKRQLDFRLTEAGRSLGLTTAAVAQEVRGAFNGIEAIRQQRGRNEVTVRVRRPESERVSLLNVENLLIRTPQGTEVPLYEIAEVDIGEAYQSIDRREGRRTLQVTANIEPAEEANLVIAALTEEVLPRLQSQFPGLSYSYEGRQAERRDSLRQLGNNFIIALVIIYAMLAIPFRSYTQPLVVMSAIPFGMIGAAIGHMIMGYTLSIISIMGVIALSGVVVNGSLVMIDYANRRRQEGTTALVAIYQAGIRRFRPIILTTVTTFGGLAPMIFETSRQARFMIPMAISLGYGILFTTMLMLLLVPSLYMILEDAHSGTERAAKAIFRFLSGRSNESTGDLRPAQAMESRR